MAQFVVGLNISPTEYYALTLRQRAAIVEASEQHRKG